MRNLVKTLLGVERARRFRKFIDRHLRSGDLVTMALLYDSDKWNVHWYAKHYQRHFAPLRSKKLHILEIGVGGYDDPGKGGESLRMWSAFFPNSTIYGIDLYDKKALEEKRIKIFQGNQNDASFLRSVAARIGKLDIIIDDGSHLNEDTIKTFEVLFPFLSGDGIYVVEDTQASYWPGLGGSSDDLSRPGTIMNFFKGLADSINYPELLKPGYVPSYFDKHVVALHFYHNLIFIIKGNNNEGSNVIRDNTDGPSSVLWPQRDEARIKG